MNGNTSFTVGFDQLRGASHWTGVAPNQVSPLAPGSPVLAGPPPGGVDPVLLDSNGRLSPTSQRMLRTLLAPQTAVQVDTALATRVFQHVVCIATDGSPRVSLSLGDQTATLREPAPTSELVAGVGEILGASSICAVPLKAELDPAGALTFAVACDLQRQNALFALAQGGPGAPVTLTPRSIAEAAERAPRDWQWLGTVVRAVLGYAPPSDDHTVAHALSRLVQAGLVQPHPAGFVLSEDALLFAQRFLIVEALVRVQSATLAAGQVEASKFWVLQAGVHDLLVLEAVGQSVGFFTASAGQVLELVEELMGGPSAPAPAVAPEPSKAQGTMLIPQM